MFDKNFIECLLGSKQCSRSFALHACSDALQCRSKKWPHREGISWVQAECSQQVSRACTLLSEADEAVDWMGKPG